MKLKAVTWTEAAWVVAQCLDLDIASQGSTEEEALENLRDALILHFTEPVASELAAVHEIEIPVGAA